MNSRFHAAALCILGACCISLPAAAGDGPGCRDKVANIDVEGGANGQISAADHAAGAQKRFDSMDADHDGKVTASEIKASHGAERIAWARTSMSAKDKIKSLDANRDGALNAKEYADGSQAMFNRLDKNGDGYLEAAEMELNTDRMSARDLD